MRKIKRFLLILTLSLVALTFTGCAGNITFQVAYDDEGGCTISIEAVVDPDYFTSEELIQIDNLMAMIDEMYDYYLEKNEYTYLFTRYITPWQMSQQDDASEEGDYPKRTERTEFFSRKVEIEDKSVFYGLYDFVAGTSDPEPSSYMSVVFDGIFLDEGQTVKLGGGLRDILGDMNVDDAKEIGLYFTHVNNYRGFYANGAEKSRIDGYNYYTWDLSGEPDSILVYGQRVPNPAGWYSMLIIAAGIFAAGSILFVKYAAPRLAAKGDPTLAENSIESAVVNPPDPFEEYQDKTEND